MNRLTTLLLTLATLGLAIPAMAGGCTPTTSEPDMKRGDMYVVADDCASCLLSVWIYEESNDIEGLQRDDRQKDDTCGGQIASDQRLL